MNVARVVRVAVADLAPGERTLAGEAARYLLRVHRLRSGDAFVAFDPLAAVEADATLLDGERCHLGEVRPGQRPPFDVTLLQGLGKGDKLEQVVRDATALGARRVVAVETERSVAKARGANRAQRLATVAAEAARQSGRGDIPILDGPARLDAAIASLAPGGLRVVLDPDAARPLGRVAWEPAVPAVLLVGPEGGLAVAELALARDAGFEPARLGPFVLRTETAAVAALSALVTRGGWL